MQWIAGLMLAGACHAVNADTRGAAGTAHGSSGRPSVSIHVSGKPQLLLE